MNSQVNLRYLLLYIPWIISINLPDPTYAYFVGWLGSFFIFFISMTGIIKQLPTDVPLFQQVLRPLFLVQIIFAGYMSSTSIFFYLHTIGYTYLTFTGLYSISQSTSIDAIAVCQQHYVLAHAAMVHGILLMMKYPIKPKTIVLLSSFSKFLLRLSVLCLPLSIILEFIPGFLQFSIYIGDLSFVACTLGLATAISEKNKRNIGFGAFLYGISFIQATVSGFKEPIIVSILLLGLFLMPIYGKKLLLVFIPFLLAVMFVLPTYVNTFRSNAWSASGIGEEAAKEKALDAIKDVDAMKDNTWQFLVHRISEISMFTQFVEDVPNKNPYYNLKLVFQAIENIVPRIFWANKPITEDLVMERVYRSNVVSPTSDISAKPATVVDAYLSGGVFGIWVSLFLYGLIVQLIALQCERLFGGHFIGIALIFTGCFQFFWRGRSFEILFNSIFWACITVWVLYIQFKKRGILEEVHD